MLNQMHGGMKRTGMITAGCIAALAAPSASVAQVPVTPEVQQLLASDGAASDIFGFRVAIEGDTAIVGAPGHDTAPGPIGGQGAAYVFVRSGSTWVEQAKLTASDGEPLDQFGISVAIDGDTAVVGAYMPAGAKTGAAYVFVRSGEPGSEVWTQQDKLTASAGAGFDYFGISVAIEGDRIVVGANNADVDGVIDAGAAYVFERNGNHWNQRAKLTASNGDSEDRFGNAVALSGDTIAVGGYLKNTPFTNSGSAYVFVRNGGQWIEQAYLAMPDPTFLDEFGHTVAIEGDTLFIGAPFHPFPAMTGAVYVFERSGVPGSEVWTQQAMLVASDGAAGDQFATYLDLDGETAIIGARGHDAGAGAQSGAAYVLANSGDAWTEQVKLTASDGAPGDEFGDSVALHEGTALVGAIFDDTPAGTDGGSVHVFNVGPTPTPADVNGDGVVNVLDLIELLLCFGQPANPPCDAADINGDGSVNVLDLIELLLAFGT